MVPEIPPKIGNCKNHLAVSFGSQRRPIGYNLDVKITSRAPAVFVHKLDCTVFDAVLVPRFKDYT